MPTVIVWEISQHTATERGWGSTVSEHDRDWPGRTPEQVSAGRDVFVAGRDLTVTNNYVAAADGEVSAFFRARVDQAAEELAIVVDDQWRREEKLRRIQDPVPLPVRWTAADPLLSDHATNIRRVLADESGELGLDGSLSGVVEAFTAIPSRRLVVIGQPGAGKTVLTLRFTLDLLARRQPGDPVPVIFGLHTWDPLEQSLQDWMAARLAADYPALRNTSRSGPTIAAELVRRRLVLPVLDGLDEVGESLRGAALRALNMSLDHDAPVILTCREADYRQIVAAADVLTSAAVIELLPLELADLVGYLPRTTRKVSSGPGVGFTTKWDLVLDRLRDDPAAPAARTLLEVLRTPLMTTLARAVYSDTAADPAVLLDGGFAGPRELEHHLLDAFVPAAFAGPVEPGTRHRRRGPRPADAERWLRSLARHLDRLGTRDLEWWRLPTAVPPPVRWLAPGLVGWITVGAAFGTVSGAALAWPLGACGAIGLVIGLAVATARHPAVTCGRAFGRLRVRVRRLGYVAAVGIPAGTIMGVTENPHVYVFSAASTLIAQLTFMFAAGLVLGVVLGAAGIDAQQAPMTTPLRLQRRIRTLSRRLAYGIGYGLRNGALIGAALWTAWGLGYGATAWVRTEITAAFPPGGVVRSMAGGGSHADYPDGLRYVITGNGRKYIVPTRNFIIYAGYSYGMFISYYLSRVDCLADNDKCSASSLDIMRPDNNFFVKVSGAAGSSLLNDDDGTIEGWLDPPRPSYIGESIGFLGLEALFYLLVPASLAGGLLLWLGFPADVTLAISPLSTVRADRNAAILRGFILTLLVTLTLGAIGLHVGYIGRPGREVLVARYAAVTAALGLLGITLSAWMRLQVARAYLAATGRLPWCLVSFLEDAHARGVLRQAGAAYQFRHVRLQERLAGRPQPERNADGGE